MNIKSINMTKLLSIGGLFTALVFLSTMFINFKLPIGNGGLIHLGNVPLFICAAMFGAKLAFLCGAVGMSLFDILSGWSIWAPFTFIIVGAIGYLFGKIYHSNSSSPLIRYILCAMSAIFVKVAGYYIAEAIIYQNVFIPLHSILGNVIQIVVAAVISFPIISSLEKFFHGTDA